MIKGIISLFATGIIFNPFVLFGIVAGSWCYFNMNPDDIKSLFFQNEFYAVIVTSAIFYVICFARVYKVGGRYLDWPAMFMRMIVSVIKFLISFILVMSFISMISIF